MSAPSVRTEELPKLFHEFPPLFSLLPETVLEYLFGVPGAVRRAKAVLDEVCFFTCHKPCAEDSLICYYYNNLDC